MSEALLVQLTRSNRRWKRIAIAAVVGLVLAVTGWVVTVTVQSRQLREAQARAERAERETEQAREAAERALYFSHIHLAQKAFQDALEKDKKP
jgi:hypothetical protein